MNSCVRQEALFVWYLFDIHYIIFPQRMVREAKVKLDAVV
jgi:hypothetical protein